MKALLALSVVSGLLIPAIAHADQCELVDDTVATRAIGVLAGYGHPNIIEYCEPCGDKAPGEPHVLDHVAKQRTDGYYAVTLDKREVDLAYTYVQTAPSKYENVAALAGCPTSGVSPSLAITDASDHGVMIEPSVAPVHVQLVASDPLPTPPPPVTYIVQADAHVSMWPIVATCVASGGLWAFATILLLRRRRAIAMRPRALEMIDRSRGQ